MISIVLYGRNDNYGYNLHKRAALSFNCMAEVLDDENDEIIFVDYNTPNDFPTFPEAIQDTLTKKAKQKLRILRVRPHVHQRFRTRTRLVALESVSRNVAVRRSNSQNRWILSTNTDMIFVTATDISLSCIVRDLPSGFYHAPRIEIPETLWEGLDRNAPSQAIDRVRRWGWDLHLNEIVKGSKTILYDGPGDFQLIERSTLSEIHGFHEDMLLGWHVDSNIARRLLLHYGSIGDLGGAVYGYHCDHTRQITPAHSHQRTENDWRRFVDNVETRGISEQKDSWGCPNDDIEEIRLQEDFSSVYVRALTTAIGGKLESPTEVFYSAESVNKTEYDPRHVLPFLTDLFACARKDTNVAWFGGVTDTLRLFSRAWTSLGFSGRIMVDAEARGAGSLANVVAKQTRAMIEQADAFIFDFAGPNPAIGMRLGLPQDRDLMRFLRRRFLQVVEEESVCLGQGSPLRQIIAINVINNDYEQFVTSHVAAGLTPFATRMRHGYVYRRIDEPHHWIDALHPGRAARRSGRAIVARGVEAGVVAYGPYKDLLPGRYRLEFKFSAAGLPATRSPTEILAVIHVMSRRRLMDWSPVTSADLRAGGIGFSIAIPLELVETHGLALQTVVNCLVPVEFGIEALTCTRVGAADGRAEDKALSIPNWVPLLSTYPGAARTGASGALFRADAGPLSYGPYWELPSGRYEVHFVLERGPTPARSDVACLTAALVEVVSPAETLGFRALSLEDLGRSEHKFEFAVLQADADARDFNVEVLVSSLVPIPLTLTQLSISRIGDAAAVETALPGGNGAWLRALRLGKAAATTSDGIQFRKGIRGRVVFGEAKSPTIGRHRVRVDVGLVPQSSGRPNDPPAASALLALEILVGGRLHARRLLTRDDADGSHIFDISVASSGETAETVEVRIFATGMASGVIRHLTIKPRHIDPPDATSVVAVASMPPIGELLPSMTLGLGEATDGGSVDAPLGTSGCIVDGPGWAAVEGTYRLKVNIDGPDAQAGRAGIVLEMLVDGIIVALATGSVRAAGLQLSLQGRVGRLPEGEPNRLTFRLSSDGKRAVRITSMQLDVDDRPDGTIPAERATSLDILPALTRNPAVNDDEGGVVIPKGFRGHAVYGPNWRLAEGRHRVTVAIAATNQADKQIDADPAFVVEVRAGEEGLAFVAISDADISRGERPVTVDFEIDRKRARNSACLVQVRVWSTGRSAARIAAIGMMPIMAPVGPPLGPVGTPIFDRDWLAFLSIGSGCSLEAGEVASAPGKSGYVVSGPGWTLSAGHYNVSVDISVNDADLAATSAGTVDVLVGTEIVCLKRFSARDARLGCIDVSFDIPETSPEETGKPAEIRVFASGPARLLVRSVEVDHRSGVAPPVVPAAAASPATNRAPPPTQSAPRDGAQSHLAQSDLAEEIAHLRSQLASVLSSTSWKITAPLRKFTIVARAVRSNPRTILPLAAENLRRLRRRGGKTGAADGARGLTETKEYQAFELRDQLSAWIRAEATRPSSVDKRRK